VFLVGQNWDELESWARFRRSPSRAAGAAGGVRTAGVEDAALERAGQAVWVVAVALATGTVLVVARELAGDDVSDETSRNIVLLAASVSVVLSLALWLIAPSHLQVLALAGSVFFLAQALGAWSDDVKLAGLTMMVLGLAGVGLGHRRLDGAWWFGARCLERSPWPGRTRQASTGACSGRNCSRSPWWGLVALSVLRGHFSLTVVGVAGSSWRW
jgi:hypothetical protein